MDFCGHAHFYERTLLKFDDDSIGTGDELAADQGTLYIVTGGGGVPLQGAASHV